MTIEPMVVRLCRHCFSSMFYESDSSLTCNGCGSADEPKSFWISDDGDCLFSLVSDKRAEKSK